MKEKFHLFSRKTGHKRASAGAGHRQGHAGTGLHLSWIARDQTRLGQCVPSAEHSALPHFPGITISCLSGTVLRLGAQDCTELVQSPKEINASDTVSAAWCWQMKILGRFSIPSLPLVRAPLHRLSAFSNSNHPGIAPNEGSTKVAKKTLKPQIN